MISSEYEHYVYALVDPRDKSIFYVGKAKYMSNRKTQRHQMHIYLTKRGKIDHNQQKFNKIIDILNAGFLDLEYILLFETNDNALANEKEIFFIKHFREIGNICNISNGGIGGKVYNIHPMQGKKLPKWWVDKLREAQKGNTNRRGKKSSQETIEKIKIARARQTGENHPCLIHLTDEQKEKILSLRNMGYGRKKISSFINIGCGPIRRFLLLEHGIKC